MAEVTPIDGLFAELGCPAPSVSAAPIERLVRAQILRLNAASGDEAAASWWEALPALTQVRVVQRLVEQPQHPRASAL